MVAACGGDGGLPFEATGTISIDGKTVTAKSCSMSGKSVDTRLSLKLDSGDVFVFPVHGGEFKLGDETLRCKYKDTGGSAEGSDRYYKGTIALDCGRFQIDLAVTCGERGPSNRKSDKK